MPEQAIRFGITDGSKRRAATWKIWTPPGKSDVYLTCCQLGGTLKASLHQSGNWHVAYSRKFSKENIEDDILSQQDRFIERWPRPKSIAPGVTLAFRIVTPYSAVTIPISNADKKKNIIWLPNCPTQRATEIDILIVSSKTPVAGWPGKNKMATNLVKSYSLANGESVWVVYRVMDMPDLLYETKGAGRYFKGRSEENLKSDNLRAIIFGKEPDGSRVMYDCVAKSKVAHNRMQPTR